MTSNPRQWWYVICTAAVLMRLTVFCFPFVNIDENEYAVAARILLDGGLPYRDFLVYHPPVIYYCYALAFWCLRTTALWAPHLLVLLVVCGTCRLLLAIGRQLGGDRIGLWAAGCYAVFSATFLPAEMLGANCEVLQVLPLCAALWCVFRWEDNGRLRAVCGAGVFLGIAFLIKYQAGLFLVPFVGYILCRQHRILPSLLLLAGWVVVMGGAAFALMQAGVWEETVRVFRYVLLYAKGPVQNDPLYMIFKSLARTSMIAATGALMWWGAGRALWHCARQRNGRRWRLLCGCLGTGFLLTLIGGRIYFHYYYLCFPFVALLAGGALDGCLGRGWSQWSRGARAGWIVWSCLCVMAVSGYTLSRYRAAGSLRGAAFRPVAEYLQRADATGGTLFVWGYCPQLYTMSGLRPATRFVTADYLTGRTPKSAGLEYDAAGPVHPSSWEKFLNDFRDPPGVVEEDTSATIFPGAWAWLAADFAKRLPDWIVDTSPSNYRRYGRYPIKNFPFLQSTIDRSYTRTASFNGYDIYVHKSQ